MKRVQVLKNMEQAHAKLLAAMRDLSDQVIATQPMMGDWTIKDMLGHLAMWYRVAITFVNEFVERGVPRPTGLDDVTVNEYNERELKWRRDWSLAQIRNEFDAAYQTLLASIEKLDDAQLNAPLPTPWDKDATLERLIAWNSYEHEPEHTAQIEAWRKSSMETKRPVKRATQKSAKKIVKKPAKKTTRQNGKTGVRRTHR